ENRHAGIRPRGAEGGGAHAARRGHSSGLHRSDFLRHVQRPGALRRDVRVHDRSRLRSRLALRFLLSERPRVVDRRAVHPMKFIPAAGAVLIPVLYSGGLDVFNLPKELAFRAEAIALLTAAVFWVTSARLRESRTVILLSAAIVAWAAITTLTSTN